MEVISSIATNLRAVYDSLSTMGAAIPLQKNFTNLSFTVRNCNIDFASLNNKTITFFYDISQQISIIYNSAFRSCTLLTKLSLPVCSYIGESAFENCKTLVDVYIPQCSTISHYGFSSCYSLKTISLPVCSVLGLDVFMRCSSLKYVSLPQCTTIGNYDFYNCVELNRLVVGTEISVVCTLGGNSVFTGTDFSRSVSMTSAAIYVPDSLVADYKVATNWRSVADFITSISRMPQN